MAVALAGNGKSQVCSLSSPLAYTAVCLSPSAACVLPPPQQEPHWREPDSHMPSDSRCSLNSRLSSDGDVENPTRRTLPAAATAAAAGVVAQLRLDSSSGSGQAGADQFRAPAAQQDKQHQQQRDAMVVKEDVDMSDVHPTGPHTGRDRDASMAEDQGRYSGSDGGRLLSAQRDAFIRAGKQLGQLKGSGGAGVQTEHVDRSADVEGGSRAAIGADRVRDVREGAAAGAAVMRGEAGRDVGLGALRTLGPGSSELPFAARSALQPGTLGGGRIGSWPGAGSASGAHLDQRRGPEQHADKDVGGGRDAGGDPRRRMKFSEDEDEQLVTVMKLLAQMSPSEQLRFLQELPHEQMAELLNMLPQQQQMELLMELQHGNAGSGADPPGLASRQQQQQQPQQQLLLRVGPGQQLQLQQQQARRSDSGLEPPPRQLQSHSPREQIPHLPSQQSASGQPQRRPTVVQLAVPAGQAGQQLRLVGQPSRGDGSDAGPMLLVVNSSPASLSRQDQPPPQQQQQEHILLEQQLPQLLRREASQPQQGPGLRLASGPLHQRQQSLPSGTQLRPATLQAPAGHMLAQQSRMEGPRGGAGPILHPHDEAILMVAAPEQLHTMAVEQGVYREGSRVLQGPPQGARLLLDVPVQGQARGQVLRTAAQPQYVDGELLLGVRIAWDWQNGE